MNPKAQRIRRGRSVTGPQTVPQVYRTTSASKYKPMFPSAWAGHRLAPKKPYINSKIADGFIKKGVSRHVSKNVLRHTHKLQILANHHAVGPQHAETLVEGLHVGITHEVNTSNVL
jgi:hypothetical protein